MDASRNRHVGDGGQVHFGPFSFVDAERALRSAGCLTPAASSHQTSAGSRSHSVVGQTVTEGSTEAGARAVIGASSAIPLGVGRSGRSCEPLTSQLAVEWADKCNVGRRITQTQTLSKNT